MSTFYTWTVAFLSTLVPCLSPTFGTVVYHLHWVPQWRASRLTSIIKGQQAVRDISPMLMRSARRARTQRREMAREAKSERSKHFHTSHLGRAAHLLNIKNTSVWCHEQCLQTHWALFRNKCLLPLLYLCCSPRAGSQGLLTYRIQK